MQDDEKYKKIKEALDRLHKQKQNSKENSNSQTLSNNKTVNNQNLNLKNINLPNSKDNLNNQSYLQNNANKNFKNLDNDLNSNNYQNSDINFTKRDYDKKPIMVKYYGSFFSTMSYVSSLMITICLFFIFYELVKNKNENLHITFTLVATALLITLVFNLLKYYFTSVKNQYFVLFKNQKIEYYKNKNLNISFDLEKVTPLYKPFSNEYLGKKMSFYTFFWLILYIAMISADFIFIFIPLFYIFSSIIYKILCHLFINKTFENFSIFSSLYMDIGGFYDVSYKNLYAFELKYELICNLSKNDYNDLRKYFLEKRNLDIDYIQKRFI